MAYEGEMTVQTAKSECRTNRIMKRLHVELQELESIEEMATNAVEALMGAEPRPGLTEDSENTPTNGWFDQVEMMLDRHRTVMDRTRYQLERLREA